MNRRKFLRILSAGLLTAAGGQAAYSSIVEPYQYQVTQQQILLARLGRGLDGLRAAQVSDLHINSWFNRTHLEHVVDLVLAQKTDLVFITGDFLTHGQDRELSFQELYPPLRRLASSLPVFSVLGNHDYYDRSSRPLMSLLKEIGVLDVTNSMQTYERGGDTLNIAGVGTYTTHTMRLDLVDDLVPQDAAAILLAHEPDIVRFTRKLGKFGMQISGHSHGGQISLPLIGPIELPEEGTKYPAGLYSLGDILLYTNRGVGMTHLPIRMNCPPEITVYTFNSP
jgi:uncharacterized protein